MKVKTHSLKLHVKYFEDAKSGKKNFIVWKNDHDFEVNDILLLKGYDVSRQLYVYKINERTSVPQFGDIIKAKVVSVLKPKTVNAKKYYGRGWKANDSSVYISNFDVINFLQKYFHREQLPDGYVVLGIEVF